MSVKQLVNINALRTKTNIFITHADLKNQTSRDSDLIVVIKLKILYSKARENQFE